MLRHLRRWISLLRWPSPAVPAAPSAGCWVQARGSDVRGRPLFSRRARYELGYRLYLPPDPTPTMPLLVMLHGCHQDALALAHGSRMNRLADQHGFAVLYPEQRRRANALGCWNWYEPGDQAGAGEAALIARQIQLVLADQSLDPARVYVAGISAGGAMACALAVAHSRLFAACAIHSGLMYRAAQTGAEALHAMRHGSAASPVRTAAEALTETKDFWSFVPALVLHGDQDALVSPLNAGQIIEQFCTLAAGGSAPRALVGTAPRRMTEADRPYTMEEYTWRGQTQLRKIMIEGLGHAWSGGDDRLAYNDSKGPSSSQLIWDFVSRHRRACAPPAQQPQAGTAPGPTSWIPWRRRRSA